MIALLLWSLQAQAWDDLDARQQAAESSFDSIMLQNAVAPKPAPAPATIELPPMINRDEASVSVPAVGGGDTVEVPLLRYELTRARIAAGEREAARSYKTLVVLGESTYTGRAVEGGLELHLQVRATLMGPGFWKSVPLVGDEVAVVRARVGNSPVALTNQNGYQVWVTDAVGELTVDLDILVPARGPRGSLEYDFLVPRTPVTRFDCSFPDAGLEPKLDRTVRASTTATASGTRLEAWLEPTSRIHLVGFKALGEEQQRAAKVYVETLSLLSIDESSAEVFSVLRYNILQAGTRRFDVLIPPGFLVVSADGDGAFRYTTEPGPAGTLLHGETAFPIRDAYEVSLRLSRTLEGETLEIQPPHALGVEREQGWIGMEVPGTVRVEETSRVEALDVDVSQLPVELVGNAVSPVLQGWRYHTSGAKVALSTARLPEREPAAGSIDELRAVTTIAAEGRARTELNVTLRNRLRHSLTMRLPEGVLVASCTLDGQSVTPSKAEDGSLLLPLKRSPGERPMPFTLRLTLDADLDALGLFGAPVLELPAFGLPVSSLSWDVNVPAANRYTRLYGDIAAQGLAGEVWSAASDQTTLRYARYWVGADRAVGVRFGYLRGWLRLPLALALAGLWLVSVEWVRQRWSGLRARRGVALALALALYGLGTLSQGAAMLALGGALVHANGHRFAADRLRALRAGLAQATEGEPAPGSWRAQGPFGKLVLLGASGFLGFVLVLLLGRLLFVVTNPL